MDIALIILSILAAVVAIVGSIVPILPGLPLSILSIFLAGWSGYCDFSTLFYVVWSVVIIAVTVLDNFIPAMVTKLGGGSKKGATGSFVGSIIGLLFPPFGIIIVAFLGAFIAELIFSKSSVNIALRSAFASFLGFLLSTGIKMIISLYLLYKVVIQLI